MNSHFSYILHLADNALILGHRLSEWCGHGPILEQDIAVSNFALDLVGQARNLYQYAAELEGKGRTEDDLAYLRDAMDYKNILLVEQPNGNFGDTIMRQFLYDAYCQPFYQQLRNSADERLAAIAEKSVKEVTYHLRWSSEWVIRLGDGTAESHEKMQNAINDLWMFTGEMFTPSDYEIEMLEQKIGVDLEALKLTFDQTINDVLAKATLQKPDATWMQRGGKTGNHSEHLGFILTDLQYMQRVYPGLEW